MNEPKLKLIAGGGKTTPKKVGKLRQVAVDPKFQGLVAFIEEGLPPKGSHPPSKKAPRNTDTEVEVDALMRRLHKMVRTHDLPEPQRDFIK